MGSQVRPSDDHLPYRLSAGTRERRSQKASRQQHAFVKGPLQVSWIAAAVQAGGKALAVGMALFYQHGMRPDAPVVLTPTLLAKFGVERKAGYRGLAALEKAGLVSVERQPGRAARVTIL